MVLAYHVIFTTYGFWLPNDPRGSWSEFVGSWELFRFGKASKVITRRSVAHVEHNRELRLRAKESLHYPPVSFTGPQARAVGRGFGQAVTESGYVVHSCSILPEHVHMVIARDTLPVERIVGHLKARASQKLMEEQSHPFAGLRRKDGTAPTVWAGKCWKVFLDTPEAVRAAMRYVEENPIKEGKPRQRWSFVSPY